MDLCLERWPMQRPWPLISREGSGAAPVAETEVRSVAWWKDVWSVSAPEMVHDVNQLPKPHGAGSTPVARITLKSPIIRITSRYPIVTP